MQLSDPLKGKLQGESSENLDLPPGYGESIVSLQHQWKLGYAGCGGFYQSSSIPSQSWVLDHRFLSSIFPPDARTTLLTLKPKAEISCKARVQRKQKEQHQKKPCELEDERPAVADSITWLY